MADPRLTPARGDLAAKHLEGKVQADRFVEGEEFEVIDADPRRVKRVKITEGRGLIDKPTGGGKAKDEEEQAAAAAAVSDPAKPQPAIALPAPQQQVALPAPEDSAKPPSSPNGCAWASCTES